MFAHGPKFMYGHEAEERFGGFGGRGGFNGRGARMGRGMIESFILRALLTKPMHGYEIISTLEEQSHGFWRPSAGSVYPTLQLLEEKDFVTSSDDGGKKVYTLTSAGEEEAHKTDELHEHLREQWGPDKQTFKEMRDMRESMGSIMHDMRTIMRKGTDEQRSKMHEMIENLRRELHTTLKGE